MKRIILRGRAVAGGGAAGARRGAIVTYKSIAPDVAFDLARAALNQCRKDGYQVAVVVLDRFGAAAGRAARPLTPVASRSRIATRQGRDRA